MITIPYIALAALEPCRRPKLESVFSVSYRNFAYGDALSRRGRAWLRFSKCAPGESGRTSSTLPRRPETSMR